MRSTPRTKPSPSNWSPRRLPSSRSSTAFAAPATLRRVVVELTEHTPVDDLTALREQTAALRGRGALIAIDDAGSGYAGLQQLAELRPQLVKLDRALVAGIDDDPVLYALAEMIGAFTGRIDAWLLAEGVETTEQLERLHLEGCTEAQGYLLSRPVCRTDVADLIANLLSASASPETLPSPTTIQHPEIAA